MPLTSEQKNKVKKAILLSISYGFLLGIGSFFAKLVAPHTTHSMIIFFRFLVSIIYITVILGTRYLKGKTIPIKTKHFGLHTLRTLASFAAQFAFFYSLKYLSLASTNLFYMTYPLFIPILSLIFVGSKTTLKSWLAIIIGFIGIALILKPGFEILNLASFIALTSGLFAAIVFLIVDELGKKEEPYTIMFYSFYYTFFISGVFVIFNWKTPDTHTLLYLLGLGVCGALFQECYIRALVNASIKIVAPLTYTTIVFSGLLDWFFWKHSPDFISYIGITAVIIGGILSVIFAPPHSSSKDTQTLSSR